MLKKKSERSFNEQMQEARESGDVIKWTNLSRRASMAYRDELERLRKIEKDKYNNK